MNPVAVCRVCAVDAGERVLTPACYRQITPDMAGRKIQTAQTSAKVRESVGTLVELLMADHPSPCAKHREHEDCELEVIAKQFGVTAPRFARAESRHRDVSSVVIAVDHAACILCDRCVRGCNDIRDNQVIGRMGKGFAARIAFDLDALMGNSSCVSCGECMVSCPTGALTNRGVVNRIIDDPGPRKKVPGTGPVTPDKLIELPLFEGISHAFLRFNENAVVRRRFQKGETICREGDYGSTAFFIEQGRVNIFISASFNHTKIHGSRRGGGLLGLAHRLTTVFESRRQDRREGDADNQFINIGESVALRYDNPVATLEAGDIFGEMTCMNSYPRSATVTAAEDVTVLEMDRNVLYILQRSKRSRRCWTSATAGMPSTTTSGPCRSSRRWPRTPASSTAWSGCSASGSRWSGRTTAS
jgi:CRP-like cAMP-binding protein/NAD-dependent dihydropyrimidine dehydrogenase PreA subunit